MRPTSRIVESNVKKGGVGQRPTTPPPPPPVGQGANNNETPRRSGNLVKIFAHASVPDNEIWVNPTFCHSPDGGEIIADMEMKIINVARANSAEPPASRAATQGEFCESLGCVRNAVTTVNLCKKCAAVLGMAGKLSPVR